MQLTAFATAKVCNASIIRANAGKNLNDDDR